MGLVPNNALHKSRLCQQNMEQVKAKIRRGVNSVVGKF
jgi:hypothetical protein